MKADWQKSLSAKRVKNWSLNWMRNWKNPIWQRPRKLKQNGHNLKL